MSARGSQLDAEVPVELPSAESGANTARTHPSGSANTDQGVDQHQAAQRLTTYRSYLLALKGGSNTCGGGENWVREMEGSHEPSTLSLVSMAATRDAPRWSARDTHTHTHTHTATHGCHGPGCVGRGPVIMPTVYTLKCLCPHADHAHDYIP